MSYSKILHASQTLLRRIPALAALAAVLMSCTGCSHLQTSVEDLMSPPVLTQEQAEIRSALSRVSGDSEIKYKYPQNGDYRSSFIFFDIDSDQVEEALVFYQSPSKGDSTWINILDRQDGQWVSVCETPAPDTTASIDFVSFEQLTDSQTVSLVVGWEDARSGKTVIAYNYDSGRLLPIFERDYTELSITDLDGNGSTDLVLFTQQAQSTLVFLACKTENGFETVDSIQLARSIVSFDNILSGRTAAGTAALFLDSTVDLYESPFQITDVLSAKRGENGTPVLVNLLDNEEVTLSQGTMRFDESAIFLTSYNQLSSTSQLIPCQSGVVNPQHRYLLTFPERWLDNAVSAVVQPENGEYTFFAYTGDLSDTSTVLLKLRVYSAKDYHDKFDDNYFQLIGQKGLFEYYAYLPETHNSLTITEQELREEMFRFLD